jgi:hypothetical protein
MRKIILSFFALSLILIGVNSLYARPVNDDSPKFKTEISVTHFTADEIRTNVVSTWESQVGKKEDLGANDSKEIRVILKSVGVNQPAYYCAAFVCWGYTVNGVPNPRSAWSPNLFPLSHVINPKATPPLPGDAFGIYHKEQGRIAHAGGIKYWPREGDYVITIEGNTNNDGSRNGDGFYTKRRTKHSISKISRWIV